MSNSSEGREGRIRIPTRPLPPAISRRKEEGATAELTSPSVMSSHIGAYGWDGRVSERAR